MSNCPRCGASREPEDRYCAQCGQRLLPFSAVGAMNTQKTLDIADVQYKLGMVYFKKEDYLRAAEVWEKVLKERPDDSELKALIQDARSRHKASGDQP